MYLLFPFLIYIGLGLIIAHFLGRSRQIGFGWSLFFCFFLSPIVGFIVTMMSPKYFNDKPAPSKGKQVAGGVLIVFFGLGALGQLYLLGNGTASPTALNTFFWAIGLVGAGIYLLGRGQGKSYNTTLIPGGE